MKKLSFFDELYLQRGGIAFCIALAAWVFGGSLSSGERVSAFLLVAIYLELNIISENRKTMHQPSKENS